MRPSSLQRVAWTQSATCGAREGDRSVISHAKVLHLFCALREKFGRHRTASGQYRTGMTESRIARPLSATPQFLSCRNSAPHCCGDIGACGAGCIPVDGSTSQPPVQRHFFDPGDRPGCEREVHARVRHGRTTAATGSANGKASAKRTCMIATWRRAPRPKCVPRWHEHMLKSLLTDLPAGGVGRVLCPGVLFARGCGDAPFGVRPGLQARHADDPFHAASFLGGAWSGKGGMQGAKKSCCPRCAARFMPDRKSTRLNSSH